MAAGEDQLEALVGECDGLVHRFLRWVAKLALQLLGFRDERPLASDAVDRAVAGGRDQPAGRVLGLTVARPALGCQRERFLGRVLGELDVAEDADQRGEHATPLIAEDVFKHPELLLEHGTDLDRRCDVELLQLGGDREGAVEVLGLDQDQAGRGTPCCRRTGRRSRAPFAIRA